MKNNKGFTLTELLIVVGIMAILVGVTAPLLTKYVDKTRKSADVSSAQAIAEEFGTEFYTNQEFHDMTIEIVNSSSGSNANIIAYCEAGADNWVVPGNNEEIKEFVNESVYSRPIRYQKKINPSYQKLPDESAENVTKYACGSGAEFTPKGWAIAIVDERPVVFVTDGEVLTQGVSPLVCPEYPGASGEKSAN